MDLPLSGRTVGVTADRRGDDQTVMFRRLGAEVLHGPTIATVKVPDPALLRRRTESLLASPPDYLIANTGIGMRTWLQSADEWGLGAALTRSLAGTRIAARGPKAAGALSSAGLHAWWRSPNEQLADLVDHLTATGLSGARVYFQLHGDAAADVVARLEAAGAEVTTLPVYEWVEHPDPGGALALIERCCRRTVDAVTFTAGPQITAMLGLAERAGRKEALLGAMDAAMVVGCIGPVCAAVATEAGVSAPVVPRSWRLGSLVKAVAAALAERPPGTGR